MTTFIAWRPDDDASVRAEYPALAGGETIQASPERSVDGLLMVGSSRLSLEAAALLPVAWSGPERPEWWTPLNEVEE